MWNCPKCTRQNDENIEICFCGYEKEKGRFTKPTGNELYIYNHTKTSHKRYEAMVLYALHFALRDVEIVSQHHVSIDEGSYYQLDAYLPEFNIAVEVDEAHHHRQAEADRKREQEVISKLDCEFVRIGVEDGSIYEKIDSFVKRIRSIRKERGSFSPWERRHPQPNAAYDGVYTAKRLEALKAANVIEDIDAIADRLKDQGFTVEYGSVSGLPDPSNGNYGFLVRTKIKGRKMTWILHASAARTGSVVLAKDSDIDDEMLKTEVVEAKQSPTRYYAFLSHKRMPIENLEETFFKRLKYLTRKLSAKKT